MDARYSLIEFIYIVNDDEPLFNIVEHNLTKTDVDKIVAARPIVYKGHRKVKHVGYKIKSTADMNKYLENNKAKWNEGVNVGGFFSIENILAKELTEFVTSLNENATTLNDFNFFCFKNEQYEMVDKLNLKVFEHNETVKIYFAGCEYLKEIRKSKNYLEQ
jgi:hypothetical protein